MAASTTSTQAASGLNPYAIIRDDLLAFAQYTFPGYAVSWHHQEIASRLTKVRTRDIRRLAMSIRPQVGKSEMIRQFIAWTLGHDPDTRFILITYSADKAEQLSRQVRDTVESVEFQRLFPGVTVDRSSRSVSHWEVAGHRGYVHAVGVGGPITGFSADIVVIDDPIKDAEQADSPVQMDALWTWWKTVALTRLAPDGAVIVIHTRWNENDFIGRLLAEKHLRQWTVLNIPAVSPERVVWPERFSREWYAETEAESDRRTWNALYMGNPVPPEGALFRRSWFVISPRRPEGLRWIRAWDLATSEKTSADYTVGVRMAVDTSTKTVWLDDMVRGQWEWPEARRRIVQTANIDGPEVAVHVEKGAFKMSRLVEDLIDNWEQIDIPIRGVTVRGLGDKVNRANPAAARAEAGRFVLVEGPWVKEFLDEITVFPFGEHDDIPDAVSLGFHVLSGRRLSDDSDTAPAPQGTKRYFSELARLYERERRRSSGTDY